MKYRTNIPETIKQKIYKLYKEERTMLSLAREFEIAPSTLRRMLMKAGVHDKRCYTQYELNETIKQKIYKLYKEERTMLSLAREFELPSSTVRRMLKKTGVYDKKRYILQKQKLNRRNKDIFRLYKKGRTIASLAKEFELSPSRITKILMKAGVYDKKRYIQQKQKLSKRNKKIAMLYKQGKSMNSIAKEFELAHRTIRYVLKKEGLYKKTIFVTPILTKSQRKKRNVQICKLYKSGETLTSIGERYHRDMKAIVFVLKKAGIYRPTRIQLTRKEKEERREQIEEMRRGGMSHNQIARALAMHRPSVSRILHSMGLG